MEQSIELFEQQRNRLVALAYGLLGSHTEAEDVVQEAWLRFSSSDDLRQPEAWLTTVVTRIALDHLRSARHRRETYPGVWLPEPVSTLPDPESTQSLRSLLSVAFLHILEKLSPEERSIFVLREGFERRYEEIAGIIGKTEAACRQMYSRARKRVQQEGGDGLRPVPHGVVQRCIDALTAGDEKGLLALLATDAVLYGDGGGKVPSVLNPIFGADRIVRFFFGLLQKFPGQYRWRITGSNGEPAMLVQLHDRLSVLTFAWDSDRITGLRLIGNPDKLADFATCDSIPAKECATS